jgi:hypothetical protein
MDETQQAPPTVGESGYKAATLGKPLSRAEILRLVRDQLSGAAWEPFFERRTVTRKFGRMWVVHLSADRADSAGGPWIYTDSRGRIRHVDFTGPVQRLLRILALLVLLIGLALIVSRSYPKRWCGTELTASGATRNICRDPEVTDPAIVALGVVILAALGIFYTEISGFGLTFRRRVDEADSNARESLSQISELQAVRKLIQETQADFADTNKQTDDRLRNLEHALREIRDQLHTSGNGEDGGSHRSEEPGEPVVSAILVEPGPPYAQPPSPGVSSTADDAGVGRADPAADGLSSDEVLGYAAAYNRCRSTMVAGPDRSARMEELFRGMRSAVKSIQVSHSGIKRALLYPSNDRGIRLTAYAYLIEHPLPDLVTLLVNVAANEEKPFGQYCALRAVSKLVQASTSRLTPELTTRLNEVAITAGRGTDRAREVANILAEDRKEPTVTT